MPYEDFPKALSEIHRVSSSHAVFSVPDSTRAYRLDVQIPKIGEVRKLIQLPRLRPPKHRFNGEHYWEIGKGECNLRKIMDRIHDADFELKRLIGSSKCLGIGFLFWRSIKVGEYK